MLGTVIAMDVLSGIVIAFFILLAIFLAVALVVGPPSRRGSKNAEGEDPEQSLAQGNG